MLLLRRRTRNAQSLGFKNGLRSVLRGGSYGSSPVRVRKFVGSAATDNAERYEDVATLRRDVRRAEQGVLDGS